MPSSSTLCLPILINVNFEHKNKLDNCISIIKSNHLIKSINSSDFVKLNNNNIAYNLQLNIGEMNFTTFSENEIEIKKLMAQCNSYGAIHHYDFSEEN